MVMRVGKTEKAWKDLYLQTKREIADLKAENSHLKQQVDAIHRNIEDWPPKGGMGLLDFNKVANQ